MKIPESFELFGRAITVVRNDSLLKETGALGSSDYLHGVIELQMDGIPGDLRLKMFLHELTHFIFDTLGLVEQSENELLVDTVAGLIHQFIETRGEPL